MANWEIDTWLLVGIVLTGLVSAVIAGFALHRMMRRARRDRTWRRLDRLSVPLDDWVATIDIRDPMWAQSIHNGDMRVIPKSTYDAAISGTLPDRINRRVERYFKDRKRYADKCIDLLSSVEEKVTDESGLSIVDYEKTGEGLYLRMHFVNSIYCSIYMNLFAPEYRDYEYIDKDKPGPSPSGQTYEMEFRWPRGPMDNWVVIIAEHVGFSDSGPLIVDVYELKTLHKRLLDDPEIEGASAKMTGLDKQYQSLVTEVADLQSEIADFRAH